MSKTENAKVGDARKSVPAKRKQETFKAGIYECSKCKNVVTINVDMTLPPVCWSHLNKTPFVMERKGK